MTKNLAQSALLMTSRHAVVVRLELFSSPTCTLSVPGEHSGASSSVSTTSSGVFPPSSLPGLQGRARVRSITPNRFQHWIILTTLSINLPCSETESGECSEGEMSDLTPCNASPSLSQLLSWTGRRYSTHCQCSNIIENIMKT